MISTLRSRSIFACTAVSVALLMLPTLSFAQESPFLTGATALQTNILAWMTPVAIVHAASAELAFEQLALLVKQNEAGREMSREDIRQLLGSLVDVVIQFAVHGHVRYIKEIWYGPARAAEHGHC
jgi:type IV secretion system protein VirB11